MSFSKNQVQLIGRLGAAPEIKKIENGSTMARLRVATAESYKNAKGEWVTETQWHTVTAWGRLAERAAQGVDKGAEVFIEGRLEHRNYTGNDGQRKYYTDIVAQEFYVMQKQAAESPAA